MTKVTLEIDLAVSSAYIRLGDTDVTETVEVTDEVMVDLDQFGMVVGFELLDTEADLPLNELCDAYHVREDVLKLLTSIAPSLKQRIRNPLSNDNEGDSSGATELTFA